MSHPRSADGTSNNAPGRYIDSEKNIVLPPARHWCTYILSKGITHTFFTTVLLCPPPILVVCWFQMMFNKEREGRQLLVVSAASLDLTVDASSGGETTGKSTHILSYVEAFFFPAMYVLVSSCLTRLLFAFCSGGKSLLFGSLSRRRLWEPSTSFSLGENLIQKIPPRPKQKKTGEKTYLIEGRTAVENQWKIMRGTEFSMCSRTGYCTCFLSGDMRI